MDKAKKKRIKKIIALVCIFAVVLLLAAMPLLVRQPPEDNGPQASILSGTVQVGSIEKELIGGGTLAEENAISVSIPSGVTLTAYHVESGNIITAGTPIASVDQVTVMTAIASVQETLDYLAKQIEAESGKSADSQVLALAGGAVKLLYGQEGDSVLDIMLEHGALAVLSLDGRMAVDITTESTLSVGSTVTVTLSNGETVTGNVESNLAGEMTVTVKDDNYAIGENVQISIQDGTAIGSGALYIFNPWNATAYTGSIQSVHVSEGDAVAAGDLLIQLSDVGSTATYRQLINQRQKYEDLMQELFQMYRSGRITAPTDGIVSGIDTSVTAVAAAVSTAAPETSVPSMGGNWGDYPSMDQTPSFTLHSLETVQIAAVTPQNTMTLDISIDELDITALKTGMEAEVKINALGGEKFAATITNISNTGTNNGGNSKFTVTLSLDRAENMLVDMNATAIILLDTTEDILTIPAKALVEDGTKTVVYTGYDEETGTLLDPVAVTVGASDGENVEILSGLRSDATYYYAYYDTLYISFTPDFGGGGGIMFR